MAKQSSVNLDITNNPDGFDISGGTVLRKISITGGDITVAGSGSATLTFPTTSTTVAGLGIAQSFTATQTFSAGISASGATFSGNISAPNIVNSLNGFTGAVQVTGSGAILQTVSGTTTTFGARLATTSLTGVASFNATQFTVSAGAVDLAAAYQATGDTVITVAGSGIGISTSGKTDTLFNIGVTAFNGLTGTVSLTGDGGAVQGRNNNTITTRLASTSLTGVASFNSQHFTVSAPGAVSLASDLVTIRGSDNSSDDLRLGGTLSLTASPSSAIRTTVTALGGGNANAEVIFDARMASLTVTGVASFDRRHFAIGASGHVSLTGTYQVTGNTVVSGGASQLVSVSGNIATIDNRIATASVTGVASFGNEFIVTSGAVGLTSNYVKSFNGLTGAVAGVTTSAANIFTALNTFSAGISASGATFSGDIAVQGGDITTSSATATVFNTTATTLSIGSAATSLTIGATTGTATIRNPSLTLGNTDNTITSKNGYLQITTYSLDALGGSFPSIKIDGTDAGQGLVNIEGGNLRLGRKTDEFAASTAVNLIFEGSTNDVNDTTLTVVNPTATRTITLPDASGTVALSNTTVASINGFTGAVQVTGSGAVVHSVSGTTTTLGARLASISLTGVASFNNVHFTVDTTGHVKLGSAYQVTGQTIVAGNNISTTTLGNTVTINVTAGGANTYVQFNSNGSLSADNGLQFDSSTETLRIGSGNRNIQITPGADNLVQAIGNSNLRIVQGSGNPITIGDFDGNYGGNNTYIQVDDINSNIYMNAASMSLDSAVSIGFGLSASSLYVSTGATFNSTLDVNGNSTLGNAATDTTTIYGAKIVNEGVYANGSLRTANISFANGQVQTLTGVGTGATGITAIYFTSAPSAGAASVTAIITNGGLMTGAGMTSWGGNIKWPGGTKPVLTSSGVDVVSFVTPDAGTTIYGFVGGLGFS